MKLSNINKELKELNTISNQIHHSTRDATISPVKHYKKIKNKDDNKSNLNTSFDHSLINNLNSSTKIKKNTIIPKNVNEYQHLFHAGGGSKREVIQWMINLRTEKKFPPPSLKEPVLSPKRNDRCSMRYHNEIDNQRIQNSIDKPLNCDVGYFDHLITSRLGERPNQSLLKFETNLRNKKLNIVNKPKSRTMLESSLFQDFLPPQLSVSISNLNKISKYVPRKYSVNMKKIKFNEENLFIKKYTDSDKTSIITRQEKYKDKYKNTSNYDFMIKDRLIGDNHKILWACELRTSKNKSYNM